MQIGASRIRPFSYVTEVEAVLLKLSQREDGPFVVRLPRQPGRRESRYAHLFSGEVSGADEADGAEPLESIPASGSALSRLEQRVAHLEAELAALKQRMEELVG